MRTRSTFETDIRSTNYKVAQFIENHTTLGEFILIWGAESQLYIMTKRVAPTRYIYQYPLVTKGYDPASKETELIDDLRKLKPEYIIDLAMQNDLMQSISDIHISRDYTAYRVRSFINKNYAAYTVIDKAVVYKINRRN